MLPDIFQEELVFWFYDTHEHAQKEGRVQAERAQASLTAFLTEKRKGKPEEV